MKHHKTAPLPASHQIKHCTDCSEPTANQQRQRQAPFRKKVPTGTSLPQKEKNPWHFQSGDGSKSGPVLAGFSKAHISFRKRRVILPRLAGKGERKLGFEIWIGITRALLFLFVLFWRVCSNRHAVLEHGTWNDVGWEVCFWGDGNEWGEWKYHGGLLLRRVLPSIPENTSKIVKLPYNKCQPQPQLPEQQLGLVGKRTGTISGGLW